jgi:hypothetical protein
MKRRSLNIALAISVAFVAAVVLFFANWPSGFLGIARPQTAGDFGQLLSAAQSIFAGLALIGVVYTILRQQLDLEVSIELATAAALFSYYNEKISSLRNAIGRDAAAEQKLRELLAVGNVEQNARELRELLEKHHKLRDRMEKLNKELAPPRAPETQ